MKRSDNVKLSKLELVPVLEPALTIARALLDKYNNFKVNILSKID